jgi:hypothetical protein
MEPAPRLQSAATRKRPFLSDSQVSLPAAPDLPQVHFSDVLSARESAIAGPLAQGHLAALLWHVSVRRRGGEGRFGQPWEGRAAPSAGGLHVISLLVIPIDPGPVGLYDPASHHIRLAASPEPLRRTNAESVKLLTASEHGTTLQFIADTERLSSCYDNSESLLWRDSGALAATICFVAACLRLTSVTLGRTGSDLVGLSSSASGFVGVGAVHLGAPFPEGSQPCR